MSIPQEVCVDASLIVKLVVAEADSELAERLYVHWMNQGTQLIAPVFFEAELDGILCKKVKLRRELTLPEAEVAFAELQIFPIRCLSLAGQRQKAWELASAFGFPNVYDATYLALAALRGCQFWTADQRLYNQVKDQLAFVHWLGNF